MNVFYFFNMYKLIIVSKIMIRFCSMWFVWFDIWIRLLIIDYISMIMVWKWGLVVYIFVIYIIWEVENKWINCFDVNIVIGDGLLVGFLFYDCFVLILLEYGWWG